MTLATIVAAATSPRRADPPTAAAPTSDPASPGTHRPAAVPATPTAGVAYASPATTATATDNMVSRGETHDTTSTATPPTAPTPPPTRPVMSGLARRDPRHRRSRHLQRHRLHTQPPTSRRPLRAAATATDHAASQGEALNTDARGGANGAASNRPWHADAHPRGGCGDRLLGLAQRSLPHCCSRWRHRRQPRHSRRHRRRADARPLGGNDDRLLGLARRGPRRRHCSGANGAASNPTTAVPTRARGATTANCTASTPARPSTRRYCGAWRRHRRHRPTSGVPTRPPWLRR